jgi:hypothetical protein
MVGMQSQHTLCDAGAPVVDDQGALMAMGAPAETSDGDYLTRLIDVGAVRAVLDERLKHQEGQPESSLTPVP